MADFVHINTNKQSGAAVISALNQIMDGMGKLSELDGRRAEAIAVSSTEMQAIFGTADIAEAQILSDRWSALIEGWNGNVPVWAADDPFALLRDLINQTVKA